MEDLQAELDKTFPATINHETGLFEMKYLKARGTFGSPDFSITIGEKYDKLKLYYISDVLLNGYNRSYSKECIVDDRNWSMTFKQDCPNYLKLAIVRGVNMHRIMTEETFNHLFQDNQVMKNLFDRHQKIQSDISKKIYEISNGNSQSAYVTCDNLSYRLYLLEQIAIEWLKVLDENEKVATW